MSTPTTSGRHVPVARWAEAARTRRSRRVYSPAPTSDNQAEQLGAFCRAFEPFEGARTVLLVDAPQQIFTGWLMGVYGKVASPSALVFVGDRRLADAAARAGYAGEAAVLEATALGLGTCWIGGGVRREAVASLLGLGAHEHVYSISALGYPPVTKGVGERMTAGMVRAHKRRPLEVIAPGCAKWPAWARAGVELAQLAPSATNRQPWRFARDPEGTIRLVFKGADTPVISKRLDCGIAMLHFEVGAREAGACGSWELVVGSDAGSREVARWTPDALATP